MLDRSHYIRITVINKISFNFYHFLFIFGRFKFWCLWFAVHVIFFKVYIVIGLDICNIMSCRLVFWYVRKIWNLFWFFSPSLVIHTHEFAQLTKRIVNNYRNCLNVPFNYHFQNITQFKSSVDWLLKLIILRVYCSNFSFLSEKKTEKITD